MSRLPPIKRLATEDFSGQRDWIGKLLSPMNQFFESVVDALNNGLSFTDNFSGVVKQISVSGTYPLYFTWGKKVKPVGLWIVQAYEASGVHTTFTSAIFADWEYTTDNQVKINSFVGLPTTTTYIVTVVVITG